MQPSASPRELVLGTLLALLAIVIWAGWVVVSRFGVTKEVFTALDLTAIRFGFAGLLLLPWWLKYTKRYTKIDHLRGLVFAITIGAPFNFLAIQGISYATVSHAGIIHAMSTVATFGFSLLLMAMKPKKLQILGVVCALMGVGVLLLAHDIGEKTQAFLGYGLFIASGTTWGLYITLLKKWQISALHATVNVAVWSLFLWIPVYLWMFLTYSTDHIPWMAIGFQVFSQSIMTSIVAFVAFSKAVHMLGSTTASAFIPLVPVLSTLMGEWFLGEIATPQEWTGIVCIAIGIFMATGALSYLYRRFLTVRL